MCYAILNSRWWNEREIPRITQTFHPSGFYGADNLHPIKGNCKNCCTEAKQTNPFSEALHIHSNIRQKLFNFLLTIKLIII